MRDTPGELRGRRVAIALLYLACGALQALVLARIVLQLCGALAGETLPSIVYPLTGPLVAPFSFIRPLWQLHERVLETGSVVASVVIFLVACLGVRLLRAHGQDGGMGVTTSVR